MTTQAAQRALNTLDREAVTKEGPWTMEERREYERRVRDLKKHGAK